MRWPMRREFSGDAQRSVSCASMALASIAFVAGIVVRETIWPGDLAPCDVTPAGAGF